MTRKIERMEDCYNGNPLAWGGKEQSSAEAHCTTCSCEPTMTPAVRFNTTPAEKEGAIRDHLIHMGWAPPAEAQGEDTLSDKIIEALDSLDDDADHLRAAGDPAMSRRVRDARNILHAAIFRNTPPSAPVGAAEDMVLDAIERRGSSEPVGVEASGLAALVDALDRADRKGYLPDAMQEAWDNFDITALAQQPTAHPDDAAVDAFAAAMKEKLAAARAKGRGGWNGDEPGMQQRLSDMLRAHVEKGDPRDVANFAMFLHQRGEAILPAQQPAAVDGAMAVLTELVATLAATGTVTGGRIYFPERQTRELLKKACDALATQPGGSDNDQ